MHLTKEGQGWNNKDGEIMNNEKKERDVALQTSTLRIWLRILLVGIKIVLIKIRFVFDEIDSLCLTNPKISDLKKETVEIIDLLDFFLKETSEELNKNLKESEEKKKEERRKNA